ncbi:AI-2E family transporter [Miltoncostaea marina]|uniref:AI-2E family transporter n=1 Tax=Miltoncostaea marina TaxID=2843215 RepID=UPI001C3D4349|nr:AI-2E family transporter [Miltoncostaea marina]
MREVAPPSEGESLSEAIRRAPAREVVVRPLTIVVLLGTILLVGTVVWVLLSAWQVVSWIVIAAFLAVALMPAVDALERRGMPNAPAVTVVAVLALGAMGLLAWALIPPLIAQTTELVRAVPDALDEMARGRGPLGFLEREYGLVERAREAAAQTDGATVLGFTSPAIGLLRGLVTAVVGAVTVFFLTIFMLRDGRRLVESALELVPPATRPRVARALGGVTVTIRGYVQGNLLITLIAGVVAWAVLRATGVPYAVPLALVVAVLDLIPLVGASLATAIVGAVSLTEGVWAALIVVAVLIVYQQIENHLLQPVIYGRTVQLSPLAILIAVLLGAALAGIVGALVAIPVAGSLQVVVREVLAARRERAAVAVVAPGPPPDG